MPRLPASRASSDIPFSVSDCWTLASRCASRLRSLVAPFGDAVTCAARDVGTSAQQTATVHPRQTPKGDPAWVPPGGRRRNGRTGRRTGGLRRQRAARWPVRRPDRTPMRRSAGRSGGRVAARAWRGQPREPRARAGKTARRPSTHGGSTHGGTGARNHGSPARTATPNPGGGKLSSLQCSQRGGACTREHAPSDPACSTPGGMTGAARRNGCNGCNGTGRVAAASQIGVRREQKQPEERGRTGRTTSAEALDLFAAPNEGPGDGSEAKECSGSTPSMETAVSDSLERRIETVSTSPLPLLFAPWLLTSDRRVLARRGPTTITPSHRHTVF